jgi:hypothetical protein
MILPPFIGVQEFVGLPIHELEKLYLDDSHELYCLYFGKLKRVVGKTVYRL